MVSRHFIRWALSVVSCFLTVGCSSKTPENPESRSTLTDMGVEQFNERLELTGDTRIIVGQRIRLDLRLYRDGLERTIDPTSVQVEVTDTTILRPNSDDIFEIEALSVGTSSIEYSIGDVTSNAITLNVVEEPVVITKLRLDYSTTEAAVGNGFMVQALGVTESGAEIELNEGVQWSSSAPDIATVSSVGFVEILASGRSTITARYNDLLSEVRVGSLCEYPNFNRSISLNSIFPPLAWTDAHNAQGEQFSYSLREVYCDQEDAPKTIAVIVGAGWCSACSTLTTEILNPIIPELYEANMEVLFIEAEDNVYEPASSTFAYRHLNRLIGDSSGIRVGDENTMFNETAGMWQNEAQFIRNHSQGTYPSAWVIRTSDMKVIADQATSDYWLPFLLIAGDPDADWSTPPPPPFVSNCQDGDEEVSEPNNTSLRPADLSPGTVRGAICDLLPDIYRIRAAGRWRATLSFSHELGDLDLYLWDKDSNTVMLDAAGDPIGSNGETDQEVFESSGDALISVVGYGGASTQYNLTLELLE